MEPEPFKGDRQRLLQWSSRPCERPDARRKSSSTSCSRQRDGLLLPVLVLPEVSPVEFADATLSTPSAPAFAIGSTAQQARDRSCAPARAFGAHGTPPLRSASSRTTARSFRKSKSCDAPPPIAQLGTGITAPTVTRACAGGGTSFPFRARSRSAGPRGWRRRAIHFRGHVRLCGGHCTDGEAATSRDVGSVRRFYNAFMIRVSGVTASVGRTL